MTSSSSLPPQDAHDARSATENATESLTEGLRADALMEEDVAWSFEIDGERDGEQLDRSERAALRRVAGLSTELEDVTEVEYRQLRLERVVLVGVWTSGTVQDAENSLAELAALAETAGARCSTPSSSAVTSPTRPRTSVPARRSSCATSSSRPGGPTPSSATVS